MALLEAGRSGEALTLLARAAEQRPDLLSNTILVARLHAQAGDNGVARQTLERALKHRPRRDRLLEALAALEAQSGQPQRALTLLSHHTFEPQHQSYALLHIWQAAQLLASAAAGQTSRATALAHVRAAQQPPANLGMDDFATLRSARLLVFEALSHQAAGDVGAARQAWRAAAETANEGGGAEALFRHIALDKLGETTRAEAWFRDFLRANARGQASDRAATRVEAYYLAGIYAAFRAETEAARANFQRSLEIDRTFLWAKQALAWLDAGLLSQLAR
jgi:tetratricopeptide (TPR) repeat protein